MKIHGETLKIDREISERIRYIRGESSQAEFAKKLGVSKSSIGNYESKKQVPGGMFLYLVCDRLNVEPRWLLKGEGPVYEDEQIVNNRRNRRRHNDFMIDKESIIADLEEEILLIKERLNHSQKVMDEYKRAIEELKKELIITKMEREFADAKIFRADWEYLKNRTPEQIEEDIRYNEALKRRVEKRKEEYKNSLSPSSDAVDNNQPATDTSPPSPPQEK